MLTALVTLIIVMLLGVLGGNLIHPGSWHKSFRVLLGLDLSSGTAVTLQAVTPGNAAPSQSAMTTARTIMENRVNGAGFTGAQVQQQGSDIITVSVPGRSASQVVQLVGSTAQLRIRQVVLVASNYTSAAAPPPTPSPSGATPTPPPSASKKAKPTASVKSGKQASPKASASPSATPSPSATSAGTKPRLSTVADGVGDASAVSKQAAAWFDKVNCADRNWQEQIYGKTDPSLIFDNTRIQTVACFDGNKYVLDKAPVTGEMVTKAQAALNQQNNSWQVNLSFNGQGAKAFGAMTTSMYDKYGGSATNPLNQFAIVLDGDIVSLPYVQTAVTGGSGEISNIGSESEAVTLANQLTYGHLPLSFKKQSVESISPQLGSAQLRTGLIAGAVGLLLVVFYSLLYYRGLSVVSVTSLAISALLTYLSVVLLSRYEGFTLELSGIAGLIVAIGITADSFVVFFERLRDEVREGRSLRPAVEHGWRRARRTILVSDTVSFLAAALLYYFAVGDVKGFAFTLGLTTLIDVVVVFLFTKPMVTLLARTEFFGRGHRFSGLDPRRLGARSPWRGTRRPAGARPLSPAPQSRGEA